MTVWAPSTKRVAGDEDQVSGHYRPWYRAEQAGHLGKKRDGQEHAADGVADSASGDAGYLQVGDDAGMHDVGHRAGDAGEEVGRAGAGHRALYLPEVYRQVLAVRGSLQGDGGPVGLDRDDDAEEQEGRQ